MKKGFTLIELLAVIVILAIIALIAVPIVLNIINSSKDSANKRSIEGYAKAIQNRVSKESLKNKGNLEEIAGTYYTTENKTITSTLDSEKVITIDYKGEEIVCNYIEIKKNGTIYLEDCLIEDYETVIENNLLQQSDKDNLYSYGTKVGLDYNKYKETAHWDVSATSEDSVIATLYDNEQLGGNSGEYTLIFTGSGEMKNYPNYSSVPWYNTYRNTITKIEIEYGITSIGSQTFQGCKNITNIIIPASVTSIGEFAFAGWTNLTSITIPDSVISIGRYAFSSCTNLTSIDMSTNITSIGNHIFNNCTSLTSVIIPDSVTNIGSHAFYNCTGLSNVTISKNVTTIDEWAFYGCTSLTSIIIPDSVTSIGVRAFNGCTNLASIIISKNVTSIGEYAFAGTSWYNNQPNGVIYINNILYKYKGTMSANTSITIEDGTISISPYAFSGCTKLIDITIPSSVTSIEDKAFHGCTNLKTIYYKGKVAVPENKWGATNATVVTDF